MRQIGTCAARGKSKMIFPGLRRGLFQHRHQPSELPHSSPRPSARPPLAKSHVKQTRCSAQKGPRSPALDACVRGWRQGPGAMVVPPGWILGAPEASPAFREYAGNFFAPCAHARARNGSWGPSEGHHGPVSLEGIAGNLATVTVHPGDPCR